MPPSQRDFDAVQAIGASAPEALGFLSVIGANICLLLGEMPEINLNFDQNAPSGPPIPFATACFISRMLLRTAEICIKLAQKLLAKTTGPDPPAMNTVNARLERAFNDLDEARLDLYDVEEEVDVGTHQSHISENFDFISCAEFPRTHPERSTGSGLQGHAREFIPLCTEMQTQDRPGDFLEGSSPIHIGTQTQAVVEGFIDMIDNIPSDG
ncbi:hypothetical protein WOLCODRAFT_168111 [Wolfiporia cocos MD-104 SS10]|uniref:Uncharacterized protein n=1 Tax=Wolfiporia cocos (strain MD-104) TaxID=742152 RepID=A0A2H3JB95_WOLCO|nr:hypothetical protein WOLCODRAFT_168111 [Wolfiporia cocos MD-104 SS10]